MSCEIRFFGRKGSQALKTILEETGLRRYAGKQHKADVLVNYGLNGQRLRDFYAKFPAAKNIPTINRNVGHSKLRVVRLAKDEGLLVPDSRLSLGRLDHIGDWIEKRINSQGGYGIREARNKLPIDGKYYQKFVENREYELRVHGFLWSDQKRWDVQKRLGDKDEIAWNFSNGGYFSAVYNTQQRPFQIAISGTRAVLKMLGMAFGAADFIVDADENVYFIEINSCPGFQELSKGIYVVAFNKLKSMSTKEASCFAD